MTKTIAYIRVSTDKQAERGCSLAAQQEKLAAYASLYDLTITETIIDSGESAKSLDRPGLQRALTLLKSKKADALLVVKLDRLTRSVADLGKLIETVFAPGKAALLSVGEQIDTRSAAGRLVLNILGSVSQWEREAIGERTSVAMRHKQSRNEYIGGRAPYGYRLINGQLVADEVEQAIIQQAQELRASGMTLAATAAALDRRGLRARNGKIFVPTQIKRMIAVAA